MENADAEIAINAMHIFIDDHIFSENTKRTLWMKMPLSTARTKRICSRVANALLVWKMHRVCMHSALAAQ